MPIPKEPREKPAEVKQDNNASEALNLVDLFDQIDRAAFRRALEDRDRAYPAGSGN